MAVNDENKGIGPYSEQCFIKDFLSFFSGIHGKDYSDYNPAAGSIKNSLVSEPLNILKVDRLKLGASLTNDKKANEGAVTFMSNLNSPNGQRLLENVPKELMSNLQPKIEIFKILYRDQASATADLNGMPVPFPFNNFSDPGKKPGFKGGIWTENVGAEIGQPGHLAAGLKEFSFDYLGTNPAEVDYYINVSMKLWFNSVDAMFHEYPIDKSLKKRYQNDGEYPQQKLQFADLITRPAWNDMGAKSSIAHLAWDPTYFRIRVDVSYAPPAPDFLDEACKELATLGKNHSEMREELLEAIASVKVSFFLNLLKHSFGFRGDIPSSPFELDITYVGAVESGLYSPDANLLKAKVDTTKIQQLKDKNDSPWKGMQILAQEIATDTGLDPRNYEESTFFTRESVNFLPPFSKRLPGDTYDVLKSREEVRETLESKAGVDIKIWPKEGLTYDTGKGGKKNPYAPSSQYDLKSWNNDFVDKLAMFYVYKQNWNMILLRHNLAADQIRSRMYTRILEELTAKKQSIGCADKPVNRPSRIYSMEIPGKFITEWRKRSKERLFTPEERKRIKEIGESGGSREEIQEAKEARLARVTGENGAFTLRKQLLGFMFEKLKRSKDTIREHDPNTEGLVPGAPQDPDSVAAEAGWEEAINSYVSSELAGNTSAHDAMKAQEALLPPSRAPQFGKMTTITWFYFGDLIDAALDILRDGQQTLHLDIWNAPQYSPAGEIEKGDAGGSMKVILGDVTYYDPVAGEKKTISLLDLPISYELFREFWSEKVIKPMRDKYSFQRFLRDAMNELVAAALTNKCALTGEPVVGIRSHIFQASIPKDAKRKVYAARPIGDFIAGTRAGARGADRAFRAHIYDVDPPAGAQLSKHDAALMTIPIDMKKVQPGMPAMQMVHDDPLNKRDLGAAQEIIYLCATTDKPLSLLSGNDKKKDVKNGILYLEVGVDGTPVESISFRKQDLPYFLEAKGEVTGIKDNTLELSEPYSCSFSIYGNTMIKPGMYIYIRLPHFGLPSQQRSAAQRLGLGGYFFVYRTRNSLILRGNKFDWTTDVNCVWNAFGGSEKEQPPHRISPTY